ncbi:hypothetical protein FOCC_FOCC015073 [Frankliniella occidentalis]|nr:hypothetical protein FOCC_FOCC015073 [Frankliniella occidentalis]
MAREEARGKQPFKIWDSQRNLRKGVVVASFEELIVRGEFVRPSCLLPHTSALLLPQPRPTPPYPIPHHSPCSSCCPQSDKNVLSVHPADR